MILNPIMVTITVLVVVQGVEVKTGMPKVVQVVVALCEPTPTGCMKILMTTNFKGCLTLVHARQCAVLVCLTTFYELRE